MRIAVVHNLTRGGAHRRLSAQLHHLTGDDVVEVCPRGATPVTDDPLIVSLDRRAPAAARALRPPLRYSDQHDLEVAWRRAAAALPGIRPDVVYANPCQFQQAPLALLHTRFPSIYFCDEPRRVDHDPSARESRSRLTTPLYGRLYRRQRQLDQAAAMAATRVITNSRYTAGQITLAYQREAEVVPMGVTDVFLDSRNDGVRSLLLSVGTLIPSKGHDLAITAAAAARQLRPVVIVSPRGNQAEEARLSALATEVGVPLEIRIGIADEALRDLYRTAFATLYLSRAEPLGLASLEAQACGSPVVVSNEGGLPETVVAGVTGFVTARDAQAVAACLDELEDSERHAAIGRAAEEAMRDQTWRASAQALCAILDEVCADPRHTSPPRSAAI